MIRTCTVVVTTAALLCSGIAAAGEASAAAPKHFANCTAMHKQYPHGVGMVHARDHVRGSTKPVTDFTRNNALYAANKRLDRDHDGVACEQH